jgi:hypothetical protein
MAFVSRMLNSYDVRSWIRFILVRIWSSDELLSMSFRLYELRGSSWNFCGCLCEFQKKNLPKSLNNSSQDWFGEEAKYVIVPTFRFHESGAQVYTTSELPLFLSKVWPVSRSEAKLFISVSFHASDPAVISCEVRKIKFDVDIWQMECSL